MPAIKLIIFKCCTLLISFIAFNREIISLCSYCAKKRLVYIIIVKLSSYQPSSYSECIKLNTRALCDVYLVSFNKYIFLVCLSSL